MSNQEDDNPTVSEAAAAARTRVIEQIDNDRARMLEAQSCR